jgi:Uncharacterized conserved protein
MSVPPPNPSIDGSWTPEPELKESPPRRFAPSDYPDLNKPNAALFLGLGGALGVVGLVLFIVGMSTSQTLATIGGLILALAGVALVVYFPTRVKAHRERAERLITSGVPVMAKIVHVENLTGDSQYGRHVIYMVTLPGANEETKREVKADDRALPKRIPGPATALIDFETNDVELYCVLPLKAVPKFGTSPAKPADPMADMPTTSPVTSPAGQPSGVGAGQMGSLGGGSAPAASPTSAPITPAQTQTPEPPAKPKPSTGAAAKLPWE